jgi:hypothetical protein
MATTQFVSKSRLIKSISEVAWNGESGIITILTDTRRSVLLRFSKGRLTQTHCRSRDLTDAISVLNECDGVRFTFVPAQTENRPEIMPVESFLQLLAPGAEPDGFGNAHSDPGPSAPAAHINPVRASEQPEDGNLLPQLAELIDADRHGGEKLDAGQREIREILVNIALRHVGPMGRLLVEDAMEGFESIEDTIERIAAMIPDDVEARKFRDDAETQFTL